MDKIKIERTWLQGSPVQVDNLMGNAFVGEAGAHEFLISGKDNAGNVVPITGTITGKFLSSTMTTFALSGYVAEGVASVTLPSECYGAPGQFVVSIFATNGSTTTCIYCGVGSIFRTSTAAIAYPTTTLPDLTLLIDQLNAAIASFPADLSHLLGAIAPTFVDDQPFTAGQYVWYNQVLYRFTADHPAGSWAGSADTVVAVVGTELNSTVRYTQQVLTDAQKTVARSNIGAASADQLYNLGYQVSVNTTDIDVIQRTIGSGLDPNNTVKSQLDGIKADIGTVPDGQNLQGEVSDLKSAISSEDTFVNDTLSYINYDYDVPYYQEERSGSWLKTTGIDRDKQIIVLNRHTSYTGLIRIRISGEVEQAASNAGVDAWNTGLALKTGHEYVATIKLLSGISYTTDPSTTYIPCIAVYRAGLHTGWSVPDRTDNVAKTTFTAEDNTQYNLAILLDTGSWTLTDAKFLITLIDMTESRIDAVEKMVSDIPYSFNGNYVVSRVEENTDYDTITTPGTYRVETKAIAKTMTHCPVASGHKLYVFQTSAASLLYQVIFSNNITTRIFVRNKRLSNTDFTSWKYINLTDTNNITIDDVPDYYFEDNYIENRIKTIIDNTENIGMHSDSLIFFTDPHTYRDGNVTKTQNGLQTANLIKYIVNRTNIRQIVCGGDLTNGNTMTPDQQLTLFEQTRALYAPIWEHLYMIIGNHEWNNPAGTSEQEANMLTINQIYPLLLKDKEREYGSVEPTLGSYWIDNFRQKIRYFYLSCTPGGNISREQLIWFASEMENIPAGYTVFVLSHIGLLTDANTGDPIYCGRFEEIANILDAAKARTTYSYLYPGTTVPITGDYTNSDVTIAGVLCGHKHLDFSMYTEGGIPIIATACDRGPKSDSPDSVKVAREYDTIGEQLMDVVQIDITNHKIYLTRIGGCTTGAEYDAETGLLYDTAVGTGTEYTGTEWTIYNPYKDREFVF